MLRINGEPVDPALIDDAFARLKAEAELASQVSCCERDEEFRARAEEEVIDGVLLSQEAERRIPPPSPSETRAVFEETLLAWREHGASWDLIEAKTAELKEEAVAALRMKRFTEEVCRDAAPASDAELREYYENNAARFRTPPRARVIHLVRFLSPADPLPEYEAMLDWRRRALEGEDFAGLAKAHTAKRSGEIELGWVEQERLLNPFEAMLFSLREMEISPVFYYEQALHLVQIQELQAASAPPFEEVAEGLRHELEAARRQHALKALATGLREHAVIERNAPSFSG